MRNVLRVTLERLCGGGATRWRLPALGAALIGLSSCSLNEVRVSEAPEAELANVERSPRVHLAAMDRLDFAGEAGESNRELLHEMLWRPGYTQNVRETALARLEELDPDGMKRTIRQHLPRLSALEWRWRLCEIIADRGWTELSPALVSSWAVKMFIDDEHDRPEYQALARLHGEANVPDVVFEMFLESTRVVEQGLRTRCWEILHRIGERPRLVALLREADVPADDAMLIDLQAAARDLGLVPYNREEILWLRTLRTPEYADFWSEATTAVAGLSDARRAELALRDVPIVVSAARHRPELLRMSTNELYHQLRARLKGQRHYRHESNYDNLAAYGGRIGDMHEQMTWGDGAAMLILLEALEVPQVVEHLFDYAARDRADETTEYGGIIRLDDRGRFEIVEFPPTIRHHDNKFMASQAMLDAAYTALFHFHFHVQRERNSRFAGPGYGDVNYAENLRANCVVFTSVGEGRLNVDYYRHGRFIVDLGVVQRRRGERS